MHGLPDEFDEAMDLLKIKNDKNPIVVSYINQKVALDKRAFKDAPLHEYLETAKGGYKGQILPNNLQNRQGHFVVYYDNRLPEFAALGLNVPNPGLIRRLNRMEQTMSNFFFWFALQENIPEELKPKVPAYRLPVLLEPPKVFDKRLKEWGPPAATRPDSRFVATTSWCYPADRIPTCSRNWN